MATVTPSAAFLARIVPAVAAESIALAACVLLYIYTGSLLWIFVAAAVGLVFAIWIVITLLRHRAEWRWHDGTPGAKS